MRVRVVAAAGLLLAGAAFAQPAKHVSPRPARDSSSRPTEVVLASAETLRQREPVVASATPKRPAPRITHCRCGDPDQSPDAPDQ